MNKRKFDLTSLQLNIDDKSIKLVSSVKQLAITLDVKLSFNLLMDNILRSVANQPNAMMRLKHFYVKL